MAVKTTFDLYDLIMADGPLDLSISATDTDGVIQSVISTLDANLYLKKKYGSWKYDVLKGQGATLEEGKADLGEWFRLWIANRQHNIDRMYQALFDAEYSPIENVDRHETETTITDDDLTHGHTITEGGTDRTTYGHTVTDGGTDQTVTSNETSDREGGNDATVHSGGHIQETEKAGFNSPSSYSNDTKVTDSYQNETETTTYGKTTTGTLSGSERVTHGKTETHSGVDQFQHGKTEANTGTDQRDVEITRTLRVHGNIGVTQNTQMIESELALRKMSLAEMLLDNFIDESTYYVGA